MVKLVTPTEEASPGEAAYRATLSKVTSREGVIKTEWLDKTKDIYETYEGGRALDTPFNILYSNTEVLVPNLFSNTPKPVVRRRFGEMRADAVAQAAERMAEYCLDTNISGYPDFVEAVEAAVLDSALPGQGQCRIRVVEGVPCLDYVQHDKFIWGYAQRWEDVPWIAYRHDKTLEDAIREFSIEESIAAEMKKTEEREGGEEGKKGPATSPYYEVWDKQSQTVCFLTAAFPGVCVSELQDPLKLRGFFPSIKPLRLLSTPVSTMPRAMYDLYRQQAEELNNVTRRIKRITAALQVRGLFDGNMSELENIFSSDADAENTLIAASNPSTMMRDGGLDKHIWLIPVEKLVVVLQQLYLIRDQVKATIYEILGIGDILRGVTQASETASAQQIKDKWGSLRIKKSREKVSSFVRGYIRLIVEAAADHTPEETWAQVTGLPYLTSVQASAMPPAPPMPGVEPPTTWPSVLASLRDDLTRSYIIDIETNSTVDGAATEEKAEVAEFMNALGQAMTGLEGLAVAGPEGFEAAKAMLVEICKRFRMGSVLQGLIQKMQPPPKGPTPEQEKLGKELEQGKAEVEKGQEQIKQGEEALKAQFEQQKQQITQLIDQLKEQKSTLEEQAAELERKGKELELAKKDFDINVREAQLTIAETASKTALEQGTRELGLATKETAVTAKEREVASATKEVETKTSEVTEVSSTLSTVLEALQVQSEAVTKLLETISKPVKIVKTGPGSYERQIT